MRALSFADLPEEILEHLPSNEQISNYEKKGWYISPKMIPNELLDSAVDGVNGFYQGKTDFALSAQSRIADDNFNEDQAIRNNEFVTLRKKELQNLGFHPLITGTAALLARSSGIRLFADSLVMKTPEKQKSKGIVGWNSDKAYWPTCTSNSMLTAWIPLQDCAIDMGPLVYIDESQNWKDDAALKSFFSFNNQDLQSFEQYLKKSRPDYVKVPMTLERGQVCFHNAHTIHSSFPNTSKVNRLALAIHFQDIDNAYQKAYKGDGSPIVIGYDQLCRKDANGDPDYTDENIFPLLIDGVRQ